MKGIKLTSSPRKKSSLVRINNMQKLFLDAVTDFAAILESFYYWWKISLDASRNFNANVTRMVSLKLKFIWITRETQRSVISKLNLYSLSKMLFFFVIIQNEYNY